MKREVLEGIVEFSNENKEDYEKLILTEFKNHSDKLESFLYKLFSYQVRRILIDELNLSSINDLDRMKVFLPFKDRKYLIDNLQSDCNFILPRLGMSKKTYAFLATLILAPILFVIITLFRYPEPFIIFAFFGSVWGLFLLGFPLVILVHFIRPELISNREIEGVKTYSDFINKIVQVNLRFYIINDYEKTKQEINNLID